MVAFSAADDRPRSSDACNFERTGGFKVKRFRGLFVVASITAAFVLTWTLGWASAAISARHGVSAISVTAPQFAIAGSLVKVHGQVHRGPRHVKLQRQRAGHKAWKTIARARVKHGKFAFRFRAPQMTGALKLRVIAGPTRRPRAKSGVFVILVTQTTVLRASCAASSSVFVMTKGKNVVAYVPKGYWESSTTGISLVNVEGSSVTPTLIPTPGAVNAAGSNPLTGETVATANNTDVYLLKGAALTKTLTSAGSSTISFSGGSPTDSGVSVDPAHNRAVIGLSIAGNPGFQFLNLNSNAFGSPIPSPNGAISENALIDPFRNLLLSPSENGTFEIADISDPTHLKFYENQTGGGELDSAGEDCSTGIALAPGEESDPSTVYIADLTRATFTAGSPAGTWTAPGQVQTLAESSLSAGASAVGVAQGTHTGVLAGEFGGNEITALRLPGTSGTGKPAITDWVTCGIGTTPDASPWSEGYDPHTMTAYQSPNGGHAIGLFGNGSANWLARVDLTSLLNRAIVPRDTGGHACASGTIPSSVERFISVP